MKIVIDMNLPPSWVGFLEVAGHEAAHWSAIGNPSAPDREILERARLRGSVVLTNDLDFGAILAATGGNAPSVVQVRTQDVTPEAIGATVLTLLTQFEHELSSGSLISLDSTSSRLRRLPLR